MLPSDSSSYSCKLRKRQLRHVHSRHGGGATPSSVIARALIDAAAKSVDYLIGYALASHRLNSSKPCNVLHHTLLSTLSRRHARAPMEATKWVLSNDDLPARPLRGNHSRVWSLSEPASSASGSLTRHLPGRWKIAKEKVRGMQYTHLRLRAPAQSN